MSFHTLRYAPDQLPLVFGKVADGYLSGAKASYLPGFKFKENWETPIAEVRARVGVIKQ